jgi:hypothetical protein
LNSLLGPQSGILQGEPVHQTQHERFCQPSVNEFGNVITTLRYRYGATSRERAFDAAKRAAAYWPSTSKSFLASFIFASAFVTSIFWVFAA